MITLFAQPFEFIQSFFNSHRLGVFGCASLSNPALRADAEGIHTGKDTALVRGYIRSPLPGLLVTRWRVTISIRKSYHIMSFKSQHSSSSHAKSPPLLALDVIVIKFYSRRGDGGEAGYKSTGPKPPGFRSSVTSQNS